MKTSIYSCTSQVSGTISRKLQDLLVEMTLMFKQFREKILKIILFLLYFFAIDEGNFNFQNQREKGETTPKFLYDHVLIE